jgi:hypothetical protein
MDTKLKWAIPALGFLIAAGATLFAFEETGAAYDGVLQQQVLYLRGFFWLFLGILWIMSMNLLRGIERYHG